MLRLQENLPTIVMEGMQGYDACNEGAWLETSQKVSGKYFEKGEKKESSSRFMPGFALQSNVESILVATKQATYLITDNNFSDNPFKPTLYQLKTALPSVKN